MQTVVYPGSFDPITFGHLDIIQRSLRLFEKVIVAVVQNPAKQPLFTLQERVEMIREQLNGLKNVEVDSFSGLLVDYLAKRNVFTIVKGLRALSDFDFEFQLALMNRKLNRDVETAFFVTDSKYIYLSSSAVKEIASLGGSVSELVPPGVEAAMKKRFGRIDTSQIAQRSFPE